MILSWQSLICYLLYRQILWDKMDKKAVDNVISMSSSVEWELIAMEKQPRCGRNARKHAHLLSSVLHILQAIVWHGKRTSQHLERNLKAR